MLYVKPEWKLPKKKKIPQRNEKKNLIVADQSGLPMISPWGLTRSPLSASTVRPEDDVTTGVKNEKTTLGVEDYMTIPTASKEPLATPVSVPRREEVAS